MLVCQWQLAIEIIDIWRNFVEKISIDGVIFKHNGDYKPSGIRIVALQKLL